MTEKYNAFEHIHSDAWREGRREGREEGAGLVNQLNVRLSKDGRVDDIVRAASDKEFQQQLMKEFKLVPDTTQI